jgi:ankyrin repeat protein
MFIVNFKSIFIIFLVLSVPSTFAMEDKQLTIFQAAKDGKLEIFKELLADGIDANSTDKYGMMLLHWAAGWGYPAIVELLLKKGAHINAIGDGGTPLHWASYKGNLEVVQLLLEMGADIDCKGYHAQIKGKTALEIAKGYNFTAIVDLIEVEPIRRQRKQEKEKIDCARHMKAITEQPKSTNLMLLLEMARR